MSPPLILNGWVDLDQGQPIRFYRITLSLTDVKKSAKFNVEIDTKNEVK